MKENHVYKFQYLSGVKDGHIDPYHCVEGLAIALKSSKGNLRLFDTYWGIGDTSGEVFDRKDIGTKIQVIHYCNFDEIEEIYHYDVKYYNDSDLITLTRQHACVPSCITFYKKKSAKRSKSKMMRTLKTIISDAESSIRSKEREIETALKNIEHIKNGNLDIYI